MLAKIWSLQHNLRRSYRLLVFKYEVNWTLNIPIILIFTYEYYTFNVEYTYIFYIEKYQYLRPK